MNIHVPMRNLFSKSSERHPAPAPMWDVMNVSCDEPPEQREEGADRFNYSVLAYRFESMKSGRKPGLTERLVAYTFGH